MMNNTKDERSEDEKLAAQTPPKMLAMKPYGELKGHGGWVTQVAVSPVFKNMLLSSSRDKTIVIWKLDDNADQMTATPVKALRGHGHFVSDVTISSDGQYALSGSWDKTLRLWDINTGQTIRTFVSHTNDVLSVAFSMDDRQIVSGSRDKSIKVWNTLAECKHTIQKGCHSDWVSCVRIVPSPQNPLKSTEIVSAGWDKKVKVWNLDNCCLKNDHLGHSGYVNTVAVSPDGSFGVSGGQDCKVMLWSLEDREYIWTFDISDTVNAIIFSTTRAWICAAVGSTVIIWDLKSKNVNEPRFQLTDPMDDKKAQCISLAWSIDGETLFAGYTDNLIRVWRVHIVPLPPKKVEAQKSADA